MSQIALRCFACRALTAGLLWIVLGLLAGCSGSGDPVPEGVARPAPQPGSEAAPHPAPGADTPRLEAAEDPLPLDAYASAMIPRWYLSRAAPDRPAFTPHWYTPTVDPLFRRRAPAAGRSGAPRSDETPVGEPQADAEPQGTEAPHRVAKALPQRETPSPHGLLKDFHVIAPQLTGTASWYGPGFHGKETANGETYDQHGMTAAHPSLPMGTLIRVENEENGRVVWVRVNDRGPYKKGRILDLSLAAAQRIDMVDAGTAPVRISVTRWPKTTDRELGLRAYTQYVVQVAAYPEPQRAESVLERMEQRFGDTRFMLDPRSAGILAVVAGPYDDNATAQQVARRLREAGITSLVRRYRK